jgi:two-component system sensor histidine kinase/response regulator
MESNSKSGKKVSKIHNSISTMRNGRDNMDDSKKQDNNLLFRINELKEMNARLENRLEQEKETLNQVVERNAKFLSIVAHDLRNPFNSIIGILEVLTQNIDSYQKNEIAELIRIASGSANNAYKLLEDLLAWSATQNKGKSFDPVKINLRELILSEIDSFSMSASQKHVSIDHSIYQNLYLTADIQMVKTILRNLISNAIKYSNQGGIVLISATEGHQFIEIEVMDNGIGITGNTLKKLFKMEEFRSIRGTDNEPGTGLGLLFCKEFVEIHGGKIWAESKPGKWTKFKFTLPHYI